MGWGMKRTFECRSYRMLYGLQNRRLRHKTMHVVEKFIQMMAAVEKVPMPYYRNILLFTKNGIAHDIRAMKIKDPFIKRLLLSTLATEYKERLRAKIPSKRVAKLCDEPSVEEYGLYRESSEGTLYLMKHIGLWAEEVGYHAGGQWHGSSSEHSKFRVLWVNIRDDEKMNNEQAIEILQQVKN